MSNLYHAAYKEFSSYDCYCCCCSAPAFWEGDYCKGASSWWRPPRCAKAIFGCIQKFHGGVNSIFWLILFILFPLLTIMKGLISRIFCTGLTNILVYLCLFIFWHSCLFFQGIDAIDNGINQYDTDQPPKYVNNTHLSSRVGRLNLDWIDPDQSSENENKAFEKAMALAGSEFLDVRFLECLWIQNNLLKSWTQPYFLSLFTWLSCFLILA